MGGENRKPVRPLPVSSRSLLFLSFLLLLLVNPNFAKDQKKSSPDKSAAYSPPDSYLLDCGSSEDRKLDDGRTFLSDSASRGYLETTEEVQISVDSIPVNTSSVSSPYALPLYVSARILTPSRYSLHISQPGWHWLRLYFYVVPHPQYNLTTAVFDVVGDDFVLLHDFSVKDDKAVVFKEYLINIPKDEFILHFNPRPNSFAFINALEFVSAPDDLMSDSASTLPQGGTFSGVLGHAFEVSYRLNVGGKVITPETDTLSRTWVPDTAYNAFPEGVQLVSVRANDIKYPNKGANPNIAPKWVYSTADVMANSETLQPNFNLTWKMNVDPGFSYLIRLHFCDIISRNLDELYFNVYINSLMGVSSLDLSSINNALATAYYADFVLNSTFTVNGSVMVQIGPASGFVSGTPNGTLNGLEVIKMSNSLRSLDGSFSMESNQRKTMKIVAGVGIALGFTALAALAVFFFRSHKKPQEDYDKRKSFSSWLLPLNSTSGGSFLSSKSSSRRSSIFGSRKSKSSHSGYFYNQGLGRFFTLSELQHATQNFNEKAVVGVGGFGKVYLGVLDDGTSVAIKRATKGSEQGINEFQTELELLSKLRHRHLVSLIGFSDEKSEMILVYEYMYNGPFRDHLYGSNKPPLSWKQRLEICIGAARGLHYLHTGTAHGIIHRDVKTTNILLDDNLVAKVSDFGLSKCAPMEQGYVSTAVKGSFGYLDPEYFRTQQLTEKSDVYSFGVVLFEVLCARPVISPGLSREQVNLADWAMQCHRKGLIEKVIDPHISGSICPGSLKKYVEAAEKCLAQYGVDRPGIGDVLWNLEYALQLQDAFSQTNLIEEKSVILIPLETPSAKHTPGQDTSSDRDDSETTPASPLYTQIQNFQGR